LTDPVPGVEYYVVIDTQHRYSEITSPEQVPEYKQHPDEWELLPDESDGHFIVLRRRTDRK
jgi:Uma2 family endonuclease